MNKTTKLLLCLLIAGTITGCVTTPNVPPELQYSPPSPGSSTATIKGSQHPSVILDNFTAYVFAIDGKRLMSGRKGWNTPVTIASGQRTVAVEFQRGDYKGRTEISFNAMPRVAYEVRFDSDVQVYGANSYADFWIVNLSSGKAVTGIKRAAISLAGGTGTFIPIPIVVPRR